MTMRDDGVDTAARKALQKLVAEYKIGSEPMYCKSLDDICYDMFQRSDNTLYANVTSEDRERVGQKMIDIMVRATDREVNK